MAMDEVVCGDCGSPLGLCSCLCLRLLRLVRSAVRKAFREGTWVFTLTLALPLGPFFFRVRSLRDACPSASAWIRHRQSADERVWPVAYVARLLPALWTIYEEGLDGAGGEVARWPPLSGSGC